MAAKIYIASRPIAGKQHSYLVFDGDGDPTTTGDQEVIRGGLDVSDDSIAIEVGKALGDSEDDFDPGEDYVDRNYTVLVDQNAANVWTQMKDAAGALGVDPDMNDVFNTTAAPYWLTGPNSNSVIATVLYKTGFDIREDLPLEGGVGDEQSIFDFPGARTLLGTSGADVWNLDAFDDGWETVIQDQGGEDVYDLDMSGVTDPRVVILEDADPNTTDTLIIAGVDPQDVRIERTEDGKLLVYTAPGDTAPAILIPEQWQGGVPRLDNLEIHPTVGSPVTIPLDDPNDFPVNMPLPVSDFVPDALGPCEIPGRTPGGGSGVGGGVEPLVFDLDASGTIDLLSTEDGVHFDFGEDGFAEKVGWAAPDDGMLAIDLDSSGTINTGAELFGSEVPLSYITNNSWDQFINEENGFAKLAKYDLGANGGNDDGAITSADDVWTSLVMWQDLNSDGISQSGEMLTLNSLGITSIDVSNYELESFNGLSAGNPFGRIIEGNTITHTGTFTMNGNDYEVADVWFNSDLVNSVYTEDYTLDVRTLFLPSVRGYGQIPDLHVAMSMNEDLLDDVTDFVTGNGFEDLFSGDAGTDAENIMLAWAGIDPDNLPQDHSKLGFYGNMKEYHFLRNFTGQNSDALGVWFDLRPWVPYEFDGLAAVNEAYKNVLNAFTARLVFQSGGAELFDDGVSYNPYTDEFEGTFALSEDAVSDLETAAGLSGDVDGYWKSVALFIENTMGISELSGTEIGWLDDAVDGSSSGALEWTDITALLAEPAAVVGTSGNDTINGTDGDDILGTDSPTGAYYWGTDGNDTISGGEGNDDLYGGNNDDILDGGAGNDILDGGYGSDTYVYNYGNDVIVTASSIPSSETDIILMDSGISESDVTIHYEYMNQYQVSLYLEIEGRGSIAIQTIDTVGTATSWIDEIHFASSAVWTVSSATVNFHGTQFNDTLYATGFTGSNFMYGYGGNDTLNGWTGATTFDGGEGNDDLRGTSTGDTYIVSAGADVIREQGGSDVIAIPEGYTIDDIAFERVELDGTYGPYDEMRIVVDGFGSITVLDTFTYSASSKNVETLELFGGSQVNLLSQVYTTIGTSGNDSLSGTPSNWGQPDDIYLFSGGTDTVYEYGGDDILRFGEGIDPGDITVTRSAGYNYSNLTFADTNGNSITFISHFSDTPNVSTALETVVFADSTVWDLSSMEIQAVGTNDAETIYAYDYGDASTVDVIYAYDGNDQVQGGAGNDELHGGDGADNLYGGDDNDLLYGDDGNDYITGGSGNDTLIGGQGDDTLVGDAGVNLLEGGAGNDSLFGNSGTSTATYENAASGITATLTTGAVSDGDGGTDTLYSISDLIGSLYADTITGGWFSDSINGMDGNDIINGHSGQDTVTGGSGADTFVFDTATGFNNVDTIADFNAGAGDKIDLHDILDAAFDPISDAIADFVNFTNSGGNSVMSIDRDGTGSTYGFVDVATLTGLTNQDETTLYNNGNLLAA